MKHLNREELLLLAQAHQETCVSIYLPTHRAGKEIQQDAIRLKNQLDEVEDNLNAIGLAPPDIQTLLKPARALVQDGLFWQRQSDGLALFLSPDEFRSYRLPLDFQPVAVVGDRFHLKPLLRMLSGDGRFYVLALSQSEIRLLQGSRYNVSEVNLQDVPQGLAKALKWEDPERHTQFHTSTATPAGETGRGGGRTGRPAVFHGHGVDEAEKHKQHILRYFRRVDEGVRQILGEEQAPLILAGVDYLHPIYRQANNYPHVVEKGIGGNPENLRAEELHERAWRIIKPAFIADRKEAAERYRQLAGGEAERVSNNIQAVVPAAHSARVDTLFAAHDVQVWGAFDPNKMEVAIHEEANPGDEDLLDSAAVHTLLNGGTVYVVELDQVPSGSPVAAVYRY